MCAHLNVQQALTELSLCMHALAMTCNLEIY